MTQEFRLILDRQVAEELNDRAKSPPHLDLDRLRQHGSTILAAVDRKYLEVKQAAARVAGAAGADGDPVLPEELQRYASELGVIREEVHRVYAVVEERHAAWVGAGEGARIWNPAAQVATAEVYAAGMALRGDVVRRVPEREEEPFRRVRRACGVGMDVLKTSPLAVYDLGKLQAASLADPEVQAVLEKRGIEVAPHARRIAKALKVLDQQRDAGAGLRKGEARHARDEAQKHLEILLSRTITKVGAALGPAAATELEAVVTRAQGRRATDRSPAVDAPAPVPAVAAPAPVLQFPLLQDGMGD